MGKGYEARELIKFNFKSLDINKNFLGNSPPSVFVGRFGYPNINVGVLSPVNKDSNSNFYDNPRIWAKQNYKGEEILNLRDNLLNSRFKSRVKGFNERLINVAQEVSMAYKPVDIEVDLKKKPVNKTILSNVHSPIGRSASAKNIKIVENPKVKKSVDYAVSDIDLKASDAVSNLYKKGIDENALSKILSIGLLGLKKNRRLVPTRWSITATDDILGKNKLEEIKYYDEIENCAYFGGYLGNYFLVMFFKDVWGYELFETEVPIRKNPWSKSGKIYSTDYEDFDGRKKYAEETAGGYYASRLPVIENLYNRKKQGGVLVLRFITKDDKFPLGVWVVREAMRKSMNNFLDYFSDNNELIEFSKKFILRNFGFDISILLKESKLLKRIQNQQRLTRWL